MPAFRSKAVRHIATGETESKGRRSAAAPTGRRSKGRDGSRASTEGKDAQEADVPAFRSKAVRHTATGETESKGRRSAASQPDGAQSTGKVGRQCERILTAGRHRAAKTRRIVGKECCKCNSASAGEHQHACSMPSSVCGRSGVTAVASISNQCVHFISHAPWSR